MSKAQASEFPAWKRVGSRMLDLLYPSDCVLCASALSGGRSLCTPCCAELPRLAEPFCERCGEMFDGRIDAPFTCPNCHGLKFAFEFARPATPRDERTLDLIHRLKYGREIHLARELGHLAGEAFLDARLAPALDGAWPLVPVPLHRSRQRQRHFNQAAEICHALSRDTGLPVLRGLVRVRSTETQTALNRHQRMENLRGAFRIHRAGRRWLAHTRSGAVLVDDVLTTGSTVNECAKTLRRAGFVRIFVVTVMRG